MVWSEWEVVWSEWEVVWGTLLEENFQSSNRHFLDFGAVKTLARMVWGTFFRNEVPQSARLSAGGGGAKAIWAMPKCLR